MPTLFVDSSSFRNMQVSGSTLLSGSAIVTGSLVVNGGSGVELQVTSTGVNIGNAIGDVHNVTGSFNVSGSISSMNGIGSENYRSTGRWHVLSSIGAPTLGGTYTVTSGSANGITTLLVPFIITRPTIISSMSFEVITAPATVSSASVGVYNADSITCLPTTLFTSMSNIGVATSPARVYSGSLTTGATLFAPGLYYSAFQHSGSPSMVVRPILTANIPNVIGLSTPGNTTLPIYYAGVRSSAGAAAFLPTSTASFSSMNPLGGSLLPAIWFRVDSVS